jgi:hypothetical protein
MRPLVIGVAVACVGIGIAAAQTSTAPAPSARDPSAGRPTVGTSTSSGASQDHGAAADANQAIATTGTNASAPAKGANSFTEGEARSRIEGNGFRNISGLQKDNDGVWRGRAEKNGRQSEVWLDYKGNVGGGRM